MADSTLIEWARHPVTGRGATWNIVTGCSVVSPGCTNCYAMKLAGTRLKNHPSRARLTRDTKAGPVWTGETRFNEQWLTQPLNWKTPRGIFVAAHGDLFADGVTDDQLDRIFAVMALSPQHVFFVLTKRPERMREYLSRVRDRIIRRRDNTEYVAVNHHDGKNSHHFSQARLGGKWPWPLPNVWLGVSVEDQTRADQRIPILLRTPAAIRFISAEPLLGPIDLTDLDHTGDCRREQRSGINALWKTTLRPRIDWVIAGGESGTDARPMHPDWARALRDQCAAAGVPYFFKQWGSWREAQTGDRFDTSKGRMQNPPAFIVSPRDGTVHCYMPADHDDRFRVMLNVGKKAAGHLLDGIELLAMPEVRELADKALWRS